jgi:hypothetical protein
METIKKTGKFKLREEVKEIISRSQELKLRLMTEFHISSNTLWRWLKNDTTQSTDYNFLMAVWLWMQENKERAERYAKFKNLQNLLTEKTA